MEISIEKDVKNELLHRREIGATVNFGATTPKRGEMRQKICEKLGMNPEHVVISEVKPEYGVRKVSVTAHAYADANLMKKYEPHHLLVRDRLAQKKEKKAKKTTKK